MLQTSEKNPKITFLIRKIKNYIKDAGLKSRVNSNTYKEYQRTISAIDHPIYLEMSEKVKAGGRSYDCSASTYMYEYIQRTDKDRFKKYVQDRETALTKLKDVSQTISEEANLIDSFDIDLTLLHIVYNRLRGSTKFHLGSKESDDRYIKNVARVYLKDVKSYKEQYTALTDELCKAYEVPLEAFKGECHAS